MSLGANFSSNLTDKIQENTRRDSDKPFPIYQPSATCSPAIIAPTAVYPSMLLAKRQCPPPSPADFALYPKVAVRSSMRTQALNDAVQSCSLSQRFNKYQRFQVPIPCQPLPASANMAGKSLPSSIPCNIYPTI